MTNRFNDSWDHMDTTDLTNQTKWDGLVVLGAPSAFMAINTTSPRTGRGCLSLASVAAHGGFANQVTQDYVYGAFSSISVLIEGFGFRPETLYATLIASLDNSGVPEAGLQMNADGSLSVLTYAGGLFPPGGTVVGTSAAGIISANVWQYVEMRCFSHASAGTVEVRVNRVPVLVLSGLNTNWQGTFLSGLSLWTYPHAPLTHNLFDDLYVNDALGATNNDFLGPISQVCLLPTSNGTYQQLTPSSGTNYQNVDVVPGSAANVNSSAVPGAVDTFHYPSPGAGTILAIQLVPGFRCNGAGGDVAAVATYNHGVLTTNGVLENFNSAFAFLSYYWNQWETNPSNGGAAWTQADFTAGEFGYEVNPVISGGQTLFVGQAAVEVLLRPVFGGRGFGLVL